MAIDEVDEKLPVSDPRPPVLYMAEKAHAAALLDGVNTELGRIGYVAVTRARNLFWLGVPANALKELRPALLGRGFKEAGDIFREAV